MTVTLKPGSDDWLRTITASKIPAILGLSRWKSQWTLWHEMAGLLEAEPIAEARQDDFDYGHAAEVAAAEYWKWRNPGWRLSPGEVQFSGLDLPFPHAATIDRRASRGRARRVVEVKKSRDREAFGDDGTGDVPADYAAQIIWQQMETGWHTTADLVAWFEYGKPQIYHVEWNPAVAEQILARVIAWEASLRAGTPPALDDSLSTYNAIRRQHPDIDPDLDIQLGPEFARDYMGAYDLEEAATREHRGMKTELLHLMGDARRALVGEHVIATRSPGRGDSITLRRNKKTTPHTIEGFAA